MTITTEKTAALAIIKRGLARNFLAKVYDEGGMPLTDYTRDLGKISDALQATSMEFVSFAQAPAQDPKLARRGSITFIWGNGPDEVAADFTDNFYMRDLVEDHNVPA